MRVLRGRGDAGRCAIAAVNSCVWPLGGLEKMVIFRLIGLVLIAGALMVFGADVLRSLESGEVGINSFAQVWALLDERLGMTTLEGFKAWAEATLPAAAWDPGVVSVLSYPAWAVLGVLGIIIALIFRPRNG